MINHYSLLETLMQMTYEQVIYAPDKDSIILVKENQRFELKFSDVAKSTSPADLMVYIKPLYMKEFDNLLKD
jgi:hypothetical protein